MFHSNDKKNYEEKFKEKEEELKKLYVLRFPLVEHQNELIAKNIEINGLLSTLEETKPAFSTEEYEETFKKLEDERLKIKQTLAKNSLEKTLDEIDAKIRKLEIEIYGKERLDSPSAGIAYKQNYSR